MSLISLKLLALPSLLYLESGNMSWFVALVLMIIDVLYVYLIIGLMKKCGERTIYDFMKESLGVVLTKIILVLLTLKFAIIIANISKGLEFFVVENLYKEFNWFVFVIPLMIIVGFMAYKGIRNIARVSELICWGIIIGLVYIGFKALGRAELLSFLPMFHDGVRPIITSAYTYNIWFGSATFLLMLFGKVDFNQGKKWKMLMYTILAIVIVQFLYFVFYGLFQITSPTHNFCISDISQFSSGQTSIDELSWLIVSLWIMAQAVQLALYGYCMEQSIKYIFNIKNSYFTISFVMLYILLWSYIGEKTVHLENVFYSSYTSVLSLTVNYAVPLILLLGYLVKNAPKRKSKERKGKNEKVKNNI